MKIYLNCYVTGEGYTLKAGQWPGPLALEETNRGAMPPRTGQAFTRDKALLFWGELDGRRTGFVRDIPMPQRDENGRACFLHVVFSGEGPEDSTVDGLMAMALDRPARFMGAMADAIVYEGADYRLDSAAFAALVEQAAAFAPAAALQGALVPQTSAEAFWESAGLDSPRTGGTRVLSAREWKWRRISVDVFFYCSTPSAGFVLRRVDPATGGTMEEGKDAFAAMLPSARKILTHGGAGMALFREEGKECLVAKDLKSSALDCNGRRKTLSLVLQAEPEDALVPVQMGAWGLLDHAAFADAATGCVEVYFGPEGYDVLSEPLTALLDRFAERIALPAGSRYRDVWERIVSAPAGVPYRMLALEATLEYFCRSNEISLTAGQVSCLVDGETAGRYMAAPMDLAFTPALYAPAPPAPEPVQEPRPTPMPKPEPEPKPETTAPGPKPEPKAGPRPAPEQRGAGAATAATAASTGADDGDEERIDLLKCRWFLPAVIGSAAVIAGAVALWLHLRGQ